MSSSWRTVRVFISSTFLDMQAERDHLVRFVFPRLREALLSHFVSVVDIDLPWGITLEQGADTLVARVALEIGLSLCVPLPMAQSAYEADFTDADSLDEFRDLLHKDDHSFVVSPGGKAPVPQTQEERDQSNSFRWL